MKWFFLHFLSAPVACAIWLFGSMNAFGQDRDASLRTFAEATIDSSRQFDFTSRINGESYRVKVYVPDGKAPAEGFPVLYILDGNVLFGSFQSAVRTESQAGDIEPTVVVGIESGDGAHGADRTFDFTYLDLTEREKSIVVDLGSNPRYGGYERFLEVIQQEIRPAVSKAANVDQRRSAILGWSLGGLFVVHTMMVHPDAFGTYIALSPALWRTDRAVFKELPGFGHRVDAQHLQVRLFVGVGSLEGQMSPGMKTWPVDQAKFAKEIAYGNMVGNARDFSGEVGSYLHAHGMPFQFKEFEGDTHNSEPWSATNPVLHFAFPWR